MNTRAFLEFFKKYDFSFFLISSSIFIIGVFNLYSATHASNTENLAGLYKIHTAYYVISLLAGLVVSFIRPKNLYRYSYFFYGITVFLLVLVLLFGHKGMGAQRWILLGPIRLQPSEIAKIAIILVLARWYSKANPDKALSFKELIIPFCIVMLPTALIMAEPDLGTGMLVLLIFGVISFYRNLKWKALITVGIIAFVSGGLMYQFGLETYQKKRITTFLNPSADVRGSGYSAIQSKIAIGSGRFLGKGWRKSSQASLNYLPENHTDFVFSIYNEETGFVGSLILISLYIILFFRLLWLASNVTRMFDSIVAVGIMSLFFWHTVINMGMVMGLVPIVGLPLPFMSYGGSSLMAFGICNGVATSISNSRNFF